MSGQPSQVPPPIYYAPQPRPPSSGLAIASMVLGIVALVLFCFWHVSVPCAIVAIVLGAVARSKAAAGTGGGGTMATAGIVCGSISIGLLVLAFAGCMAFLGLAGAGMKKAAKEMEQQQERMRQVQPSPATTESPETRLPATADVCSWRA